MELMPFLMLGASLLIVGAPLVGTLIIWSALYALSPYARRVFFRNVGWGSPDGDTRRLSLSIAPWIFAIVGVACVTIAFMIEVVIALLLQAAVPNDDIFGFILVVSAGPIEEGAKLAVAFLAFVIVERSLSSARGRNPVKDGILIGMFVGCSFGFIESTGYLLLGFSDLLSNGLSFSTVDPVAWRIVLGVIIHGMYTAIASIGLGRPNSMSMLRWTAIGLSVAVILHSLNNGIQGLFLLILGMDGLPIYILIDISQIVLMLIGAIGLIWVWRTRGAEKAEWT
jgi:RsiW-degrading membrane proteinase PrsW (M82 family)